MRCDPNFRYTTTTCVLSSSMQHAQPPHFLRALARVKRQFLSHPKFVRFLICLFLFIGVAALGKYWWQRNRPNDLPNLQQYIQAFTDPAAAIADYQGRTNILILGIGGGSHPGANLTDSMMFASYDPETQDLVMIPIPRDIWVPSLRAKINTAYHYGEIQDGLTGGFTLAKSSVSEILDQPVHYTLLLDFAGFEKLIDTLGGIEINVEQAFTDPKYPIPGRETAEPESARYETLTFESGIQTMDGSRALKYVRSRNASGLQGTDLARSQRQRQVLLAIKDKLISTNILLNPTKLNDIRQTIGESFKTDLPDETYPALLRMAPQIRTLSIRSAILPVYLANDLGSASPSAALFINPPISATHDNQWVLAPANNTYLPVHQYTACIITGGTQDQCLPSAQTESAN